MVAASLAAVQAQLIPEILGGAADGASLLGRAGFLPRDVCCSAPTGSGKTLAYVLPIVQVRSSSLGASGHGVSVL